MIETTAQSAILAHLRQHLPTLLGVYAFGSQVQGTATAESDLDLAVLVEGYADPVQLWELASELEDIAGCPVDLLDLRAASTVMQYQILMFGVDWWEKDVRAGLFVAAMLSEKMYLNEARADLLADIARDGRIYGKNPNQDR